MKYIFAFLLLTALWFAPALAEAHVVLRSDGGEAAVGVLHISPGDDPVAGEESIMYLDVSADGFNAEAYELTASIDADGRVDYPAVQIAGSALLRIDYTFPQTGVFHIKITARPRVEGREMIFEHTQRVTRGRNKASVAHENGWAEAVVIGAAASLFAILVIVINRWRLIRDFTYDEPKRR